MSVVSYTCKQCNGIAPYGVGYINNDATREERAKSLEAQACPCGYSRRLAPHNGHRLVMLVPLFRGRPRIAKYVMVLDRRIDEERYIVATTTNPMRSDWDRSILYTSDLKAAIMRAYDYADVRVVLNAAHDEEQETTGATS